MRATAVLASLLAAGAICAAEPTPFMAQVGGTYLSNDLREALKENWGFHAGIATCVAESGFMGLPSADIDLRYAAGSSGSLLTVETTYTERAFLSEGWYIGLGIGAHYASLELETVTATGATVTNKEHKWAPGGKALIGIQLSDRAFLEATYHRTVSLLDSDTSSISLSIGYWF